MEKQRLDVYLANLHEDMSRSTIQRYIKSGLVTVDGEAINKPNFLVSEDQAVQMSKLEQKVFDEHELPIVYIDDNVIVIDKPAGVLTHSKGVMNDEFTVAEFIRRYTTNALDTNRPGIVHRLDRDTSGIIIGARNDETALMLKKQFSKRTVKKTYKAVVSGTPKTFEAIINLPIGRNPVKPSTFRIDPSGKPAQTTYTVLESDGKHSLVELKPKTGRTHQLRVHLQYINTPILGDRVYGTERADRLYLHAESLELTIPGPKRMTFTSDVPIEFSERVENNEAI